MDGYAGTQIVLQQASKDPLPDSLIRFEGALAWESGTPRSVGSGTVPAWARDAWLAGWDHADMRFYRADGSFSLRDG